MASSGWRREELVPDGELIRRTQLGQTQAFDQLIDRYARYAAAVAYGVLGDSHQAADVAQEAFLKAYRKLSALDDPDRFKSWLRQLVRNTALDWRRRQKNHLSLDDTSPDTGHGQAIEPVADAPQPAQSMQRSELRALIRARIEDLPANQREVVALKYLEGLSYEDIAQITNSTVSSVESRLHRARAKLRETLKDLV